MESELTIQIVGWNNESTLSFACKTLRDIVEKNNVVVRYIDNGSTDGSVTLVRSLLPQAEIIEMKENVGFAHAHNIGFSRCTTPYVLVHDPDLQLQWEGAKKLLEYMKKHLRVGAIQGKLLRAHEEHIIDSVGIVRTLTLNGKERGAGEKDEGQYNSPAPLFAVTGACALYRMEALRQVAYQSEDTVLEVFDKDFFAYKEDVDLGWRLGQSNWEVLYLPVLEALHARTVGKRGSLPWPLQIKQLPHRLSNIRTKYSFRNYIWMVMKNMTFIDELLYSYFVLARISVIFLLSCCWPPLFGIWKEVFTGMPRMMNKKQSRV